MPALAINQNIYRYENLRGISTKLNQFEDALDLFGYLCSEKYLSDILITRRGLSDFEAKKRVKKIIPHVHAALSFINQSLKGPTELSFLPAYYAILNLAKVYILVGPKHADLPKHRWHGATYQVEGRDSQSLMTESITIKKGGALALFYDTLTGVSIKKEYSIKMRDIYKYVADISAEYGIATKHESYIAKLNFQSPTFDEATGMTRLKVVAIPRSSTLDVSPKNLPVLKDFKKEPGKRNTFLSPPFLCKPEEAHNIAWKKLDTRLLYHRMPEDFPETAILNGKLLMPEEFPIAILFFHMSSVVRYKPDLLERIKSDKYWPLLMAARRHSLYKFLLLCWSFIHDEHFIIQSL